MRTFDDAVNRLRWSEQSLDNVVVGTFDRVLARIVELPLREFLSSDIPHHRARYLRRGSDYLWDRRPSAPGPTAT
jgi:hypothetical protein